MSETTAHGDCAIHRQSLRGCETENTYGGVLSFMRRRYTRDLTGVDVAVTGVPLDLATTYQPGARLGPSAIRAATAQLNEKPVDKVRAALGQRLHRRPGFGADLRGAGLQRRLQQTSTEGPVRRQGRADRGAAAPGRRAIRFRLHDDPG